MKRREGKRRAGKERKGMKGKAIRREGSERREWRTREAIGKIKGAEGRREEKRRG